MSRTIKILTIFIVVVATFTAFTFLSLNKTSGAYSSRDTDERLKNTVILYVGSPMAYVNGNKTKIDASNPDIVPVVKNNVIFAPVRFIAESFGGSVGWDGKTFTVSISLDDRILKLKQGSDVIISDNIQHKLVAPVEAIGGRTFVPLDGFLETLGKKAVKKGDLIVISDKENTLDFLEDKDLIDTLISNVWQLPVVGSYEKLVELLSEVEGQRAFISKSEDVAVAAEVDETTAVDVTRQKATTEAPSQNVDGGVNSQNVISEAKTAEALNSKIANSDYSGTNIQVQGVDEADVVKTDGEYIYQVNRQRIVIVKAYPAEEMKVESIIRFSEMNFNPTEIYIHSDKQGDKLVVIGNSYIEYILPKKQTGIEEQSKERSSGDIRAEVKIYPPTYYSYETVKAVIYDITDKSNIKKLKEVDLEGYYVSSREIGPYLYIVANKYIDYYRIMNKDMAVDEGFKPVPFYRDTSVKEEYIDIDYKSICYFPGSIQPNYMIIAGIDIENVDKGANISVYLGSGQNIYVSLENLYVAITNYRQIDVSEEAEVEVKEESVVESSAAGSSVNTAVEGPAAVDSDNKVGIVVPRKPQIIRIINEENTLVYKFAMDKGNVIYQSKGEVPGRILNQFSMDENGKYFRIATTSGQIWRNDEFTSKNNIYVLDEMLDITGKIEDIAPGEQIYSVRFMGDRAYMVTFRTVDPLFVIDLKDPRSPKILGALKIPGYSDYLHPYDENHIIGFGKDTVEVKGQAYYLGMKIALFDVTDVSNPIQKFSETIGDRGTESEILRNHKALLFSKEKGLMAFPVTVMEVKGKNKFNDGGFPEYGQFSFQGAYVYNVDLTKGFTLKGRITHLSNDEYLRAGRGWYESDKNINRILYIKDVLYTLSNSMVKANGLVDLDERNEVIIDGN
ncbi:MAG: beta-propeller domain-containing protein [Firmicutes bacterium]|nr:beta-propeller domain-containing protein [Bacillota bacterium]